MTKYLDELESAGYIKKFYTWFVKTGKQSKLSRYRLSDNYLRFYFKYIAPKLAAIDKGRFIDQDVDQLPGWKSMLGLQFENLVLNNRDSVIQALGINPSEIVMDDPYFQTTTARQASCQVDYLIQTKLNTLFVCEIKFSDKIKSAELIKQMQEKIKKITLPRGYAILPVLIHFTDIEDDEALQEYFYKTIDFRAHFSD